MTKLNKGQMSLEMIIGLVILLVVAGVIIAMLLHFLNPDSMPNIDEELNERGFITECDKLCDSGDMAEYCSYYYGKGEVSRIDLNKDNQENSRVLVGGQDWPACESRVYCFLYAPCRRMGTTSTNVMKKCSEILCNNYLNKYEDNAEHANRAVLDKISISTEETGVPYCNFLDVSEEENWHNLYFPEDVCGTGGESTSIGVTNCVLDKLTSPYSFVCDTTCTDASVVLVRDLISGKTSTQIPPTIAGGVLNVTASLPDIATFTCPETWSVTLFCNTPPGEGAGILNCPP